MAFDPLAAIGGPVTQILFSIAGIIFASAMAQAQTGFFDSSLIEENIGSGRYEAEQIQSSSNIDWSLDARTQALNFQSSGNRKCYRETCPLWLRVSKETQIMDIYINGELDESVEVSTGVQGYKTPDFDKHPNGRIYERYTSNTYPGGDYKGLGNMPYAIFISGGYAIHGTTPGNFRKLGNPDSHGCIRLHPEEARDVNELVRAVGIKNTWITVSE